jgi:bacteriorhodopsin
MNDSTNLDRIRGAALDRVDKARRIFWILVVLTGLCEGGLLVTVVLLMDWSDPLHRLLLATAALIYLTLGTAIIALGAYVNWCTQRVLRALSAGE